MGMRFSVGFFGSALALSAVLSGCSSQPVQKIQSEAEYLHDEAFPGYREYAIESRDEIFYLDQEIRAVLDKEFEWTKKQALDGERFSKQVTGIVKDFTFRNLSDAPASQIFHDKMANCLSMSIMTYSMARYLGVKATFQMVSIPEYWERHRGNSLVARHVNLLLEPETEPGIFEVFRDRIIIDYFSPNVSRVYPSRRITVPTVMAMFYNNRGAEALLAGRNEQAYAYFRASLKQDSSLSMTLSNLALLYARAGRMDWAEQTYLAALKRNRDDTVSAAGLAAVYRLSGKFREANEIMQRVKKMRENNPYYMYVEGEEAYAAGQWKRSVAFFKKSISLRPDIDLFYFSLAKSYFQMGEYDLAERYMLRAERTAQHEEAKNRYRSKVVLLNDY